MSQVIRYIETNLLLLYFEIHAKCPLHIHVILYEAFPSTADLLASNSPFNCVAFLAMYPHFSVPTRLYSTALTSLSGLDLTH